MHARISHQHNVNDKFELVLQCNTRLGCGQTVYVFVAKKTS